MSERTQAFSEKETLPLLYELCACLGVQELEDVLTAVFRNHGSAPRVELFRHTIEAVRASRLTDTRANMGRDLRVLQQMETDLLHAGKQPEWERVSDRIRALDLDLALPVLLKDRLKLEDSEILQILQIRWGVFRHRLHRGRVELMELFTGTPVYVAPDPQPSLTEGEARW